MKLPVLRDDRLTMAHVALAAVMGTLGVLATLPAWKDIYLIAWMRRGIQPYLRRPLRGNFFGLGAANAVAALQAIRAESLDRSSSPWDGF